MKNIIWNLKKLNKTSFIMPKCVSSLDSKNILVSILFSIISFIAQSQNKNIVIYDSLPITSEKYNVIGTKLKKLKFGEFIVVKAKPIWIKSTTHNTHKTYEENIERKKFSFTLVNTKSESAEVKAVYEEISRYQQTGGFLLQATTGLETTNYEGLNNFSNVSASISLNNNSEHWYLILEEVLYNNSESIVKGSIGNDERIIDIEQVYFDKDRTYVAYDSLSYAAIRFEFIENNQSLGAMRKEWNLSTDFWFRANLESSLKLIIAATMTVINETEFSYRFKPTRK